MRRLVFNRPQRHLTFIWSIIWLLPPLRALWLIHQYAVNIPFGDDFDAAIFVNTVHEKGLHWADLIAQHNESRFFILRLLTLGLTHLHHALDMRLLMLASLLTVLLTGALLLRLIRNTFDSSLITWPIAILVNLLLFLPSQWINFLWGVQWIVFVPAGALLVGLLMLDERISLRRGLPISIFAALFATYTNSNGFVIWGLLIPMLWWRNDGHRWRSMAVWLTSAALSIGYFFHNYDRSSSTANFHLMIARPIASAEFLLAFLGNGLRCTDDANTAAVIGLTAVALFAAGILILFTAGELALIRKSQPWMILAGYSLASGMLATAGRFSLGLSAAIPPRYPTFAIPFFVALIVVWILAAKAMPGRKTGGTAIAVVGMTVLLSIRSGRFIGGEMKRYHAARLSAVALVQWSHLATDDRSAAITLFPSPGDAYATLERLRKNDFVPADSFIRKEEIPTILNRSFAAVGEIESIKVEANQLNLSGWAMLPGTMRSPDLILITQRLPGGSDRLIAVTGDVRRRHMLGVKPADLGWNWATSAQRVPSGAVITAWAYDASSRSAHPLSRR